MKAPVLPTPETDESGHDTLASAQVSPANGIQVIGRAAAILRTLSNQSQGLSLGEIASRVQLPRSTVQRIVDALSVEGLVMTVVGRGVRLGPAILSLANSRQFEIADLLLEGIQQLSALTGESVDLSVFDRDKAVFLHQVAGNHRLRTVSSVGAAFGLHCSANGKAMLAALDPVRYARLRARLSLPRLTDNTIVTWQDLDEEVEHIRRTGVAINREEHTPGVCAVAVPLEGPRSELVAVSIQVPAARFQTVEKKLIKQLLASRAQLARLLKP